MWNLISLSGRLLLKKELQKKSRLVILILLPFVCFLTTHTGFFRKKQPSVVYIYAESADRLSQTVCNNLIGEYDGYSVTMAQSRQEIYTKVKTSEALCGYILPENLEERCLQGVTVGNIILVERMGCAVTDIVNEIVFSEFYKEYAKTYSASYGEKICAGPQTMTQFYETFDKALENTENRLLIEKHSVENLQETPAPAFLIKLFLAVFLCLYLLLHIYDFLRDKEHGILVPVPETYRPIFCILYFLTPLVILLPVLLLIYILISPVLI